MKTPEPGRLWRWRGILRDAAGPIAVIAAPDRPSVWIDAETYGKVRAFALRRRVSMRRALDIILAEPRRSRSR